MSSGKNPAFLSLQVQQNFFYNSRMNRSLRKIESSCWGRANKSHVSNVSAVSRVSFFTRNPMIVQWLHIGIRISKEAISDTQKRSIKSTESRNWAKYDVQGDRNEQGDCKVIWQSGGKYRSRCCNRVMVEAVAENTLLEVAAADISLKATAF